MKAISIVESYKKILEGDLVVNQGQFYCELATEHFSRANYSEAVCAESEADYLHKLGIARKEANETIYWLKLIHQCGYIDAAEFQNLVDCAEELIRILTSIIMSIKKKHTSNI